MTWYWDLQKKLKTFYKVNILDIENKHCIKGVMPEPSN